MTAKSEIRHPMDRAFDALLSGIGYFIAFLLCAMALLISVDVALKAFRIGNLEWLNEVSEYALYCGTFLGAPWALHLGAHVRVDFLAETLSPSIARRLEQAVDLAGTAICATLAYYGVVAVILAHDFGYMQYKTITLPDWPLLSVFAISMMLLTVEFLRRFWQTTRSEAVSEDERWERVGF